VRDTNKQLGGHKPQPDSRKGHEQIATTNIYLHADMTHKQQAIDRTRPIDTKPGRYRPPDALLAFLESL
jgi:integrase/recombinase XerD